MHKVDNNRKKITVIGGGAAGLAAAISAARIIGGEHARIIEKNDRVGRKLLATGNGRCNYTNSHCRDVEGTLQFFQSLGILPREEAEGRVYPYSEQAAAVQEALKTEAEALGVEILCNSSVRSIKDRFIIELDNGEVLQSRKVILAAGGKAGIQYGSSGEGFQMAMNFGHTVRKPIPALVPVLSDDPLLKPLKGVRAKGKATLLRCDRKVDAEYGEIQFTGEGLSGICVFDLSRNLRLESKNDSYQDFAVQIDFFPEFDLNFLYDNLKQRREFLKERKKDAFLNGLLHQKLADAVFQKLGFALDGISREWTDQELKSLSELLKGWEFVLSGTKGWKEAQTTSGGIELSEIEQTTMESKKVEGLYFAGEIMDVDEKCGGYNLQWAWSSGLLAGKAAAESV